MTARTTRKPMLFAVEKLSPAGRQLVDTLLARNATFDAVARELKNRTGESVGKSSLWRYRLKIWIKEPESKKAAARRTHQLLGEVLIVAAEIRDAVRALGARQLRAIGSGQGAAKEATEKKGGEGE